MPLTGFNELKRKTIRDQICANDDSGLGESVEYIFRNGDRAKFDAQVSFTSQTEVEENTNLRVWQITVLIMKEHLGYRPPQIGDQIILRDIRWDAGVAEEKSEGRTYGTEAAILEEGSSWWRAAFIAEKLATNQVKMQGGR